MILTHIFQKDLKLLISGITFACLKATFSFCEPCCYIYYKQKIVFFDGNY